MEDREEHLSNIKRWKPGALIIQMKFSPQHENLIDLIYTCLN